MSSRLLAPVRSWEARRALRVARRLADDEIAASRMPSPRHAWRVAELVGEANRVELARSLMHVVHSADERLLPAASPLVRTAVRTCRAELLDLASVLFHAEEPVSARGVLRVEALLAASGPLYGAGDAARLRRDVARALQELRDVH